MGGFHPFFGQREKWPYPGRGSFIPLPPRRPQWTVHPSMLFVQFAISKSRRMSSAHGSGGFSSNAINPIDEVDAEYHGDSCSAALCRRCDGPFLIKQSMYGVPCEFEAASSETILYPTASRLALEQVPEGFNRAYEQAQRRFATAFY